MSEPHSSAQSDFSRHAISVLIVTAAILWNVVAATRAPALQSPDALLPGPERDVWIGVAYAQVMLAAAYLAWGRWNIAIRASVLSIVLIASSILVAAILGFYGQVYLWVFLGVTLGIAVPLGCVRLLGLQLVHPDLSPSEQRLRQFTIWQLLSLMTAVAILLTLSRWAIIPGDVPTWRIFTTWLLPQSAIGIACLTLPLFLKRWRSAACITGAVSVLHGLGYLSMSGNYRFLWLAMIQWFFVVGCCGLIRLAGYRLAWQLVPTNQPISSAPPHTTAHPGT